MIRASVTFRKEIHVIAVGETLEEVKAAAEAAAEDNLRDWDDGDEWDVNVYDVKKPEGPCHVGVVDNELVEISDYNAAKGTSIPSAD